MNIEISPISSVSYLKNTRNNKTVNIQAGQSMQAPSFKSTKMLRNTMLALAILGSSAMVSCRDSKSDSGSERIRIESVIGQLRGIVPETFSLKNPETSILDDDLKVSKEGEYTITETPLVKIIRRDFAKKEGYEETTYYQNGDYSYEYSSAFPLDDKNEDYAIEQIYEYYNKDGEVLYWVNKTLDHAAFHKNGVIQYNEGDEYKGCKRIRKYDEYGDIKADYFKSKSGIITNADVVDNL